MGDAASKNEYQRVPQTDGADRTERVKLSKSSGAESKTKVIDKIGDTWFETISAPALQLKVGDKLRVSLKVQDVEDVKYLADVVVAKAGRKGYGTVELNLNGSTKLGELRRQWLENRFGSRGAGIAHLCRHYIFYTRSNYNRLIEHLSQEAKMDAAIDKAIDVPFDKEIDKEIGDSILNLHRQLLTRCSEGEDPFDVIQQCYDGVIPLKDDRLILSGRTATDEIYATTEAIVTRAILPLTAEGRWFDHRPGKISIVSIHAVR